MAFAALVFLLKYHPYVHVGKWIHLLDLIVFVCSQLFLVTTTTLRPDIIVKSLWSWATGVWKCGLEHLCHRLCCAGSDPTMPHITLIVKLVASFAVVSRIVPWLLLVSSLVLSIGWWVQTGLDEHLQIEFWSFPAGPWWRCHCWCHHAARWTAVSWHPARHSSDDLAFSSFHRVYCLQCRPMFMSVTY